MTRKNKGEDMLSLLTKIGLWLLKLASNSFVQEVLRKTVANILKEGEEAIPLIKTAISVASNRQDLNGTEKFNYVLNSVKEQFPEMASDVLRGLVQDTFNAYMSTT
jgi:hypothetical protein